MTDPKDRLKISVAVLALFCALSGTSGAAMRQSDHVPAFTLNDVSGREFTLADFIGPSTRNSVKGVMIGFFASWCGPCRQELSLIRAMQAELAGKGVAVVLINVKDSPATIKSLLEEFRLDGITVLSDREGKTAERYQVLFLPTTFFVGQDGIVKDVRFGELGGEQDVRAGIEKATRQ